MEFVFGDLLPVLRDIALVILALESIVIGLVILIILFQVWKLIGALRGNVTRLTELAREVLTTSVDTARNVRGTTEFVTDRAARPVIEVLSVVAAAAEFARAAFSGRTENGRKVD